MNKEDLIGIALIMDTGSFDTDAYDCLPDNDKQVIIDWLAEEGKAVVKGQYGYTARNK